MKRLMMLLILAWVAVPGLFAQQAPPFVQDWYHPVACSLNAEIVTRSGRTDAVYPGEEIEIAMGEEVTIRFHAYDQHGSPFPENRFAVMVDGSGQDCISVDLVARGEIRLRACGAMGTYDVLAFVPGNLNLTWPIRIEVAPFEAYTVGQARFIVRGLYRAILGRKPDEAGFKAGVMEVQRGRLKEQVKAMFKSREFLRKRSALSATALLDQIYLGLLNRKPDSRGVRTYLSKIEKKKYASVMMKIIASEEYQRRLVKAR